MFSPDQPLRRRPRQFTSESITPSDSGSSSSASFTESTSPSDPSSTASSPSSLSSDFSSTTSESERSTTQTVASSTSRSNTLSSATPTSLFTSFTSTSSHETLTTAPPSSSPPSLTTSPEPSTPSSGFVLSTFTSSFVSEINGSPTTIVTPIVTSLRTSSPSRGSSRTGVIAGSAVAGIIVLIIALATIFIVRRRVRRQRYWALSRKRLPSRATFLAGEDMDLPFPVPPFASADHDDPFSSRSIHRINSVGSGGGDALGMNPYTQSFYAPSQSSHAHAATSSSSSPPRFLRARASESGSIFQEAVWPPPASQLMDPLTSASQSVDLTRVVTDVMGPQAAAPETGPLLPSLSREHGRRDNEPERGQEGPERQQGPTLRPLSLTIAPPTNLYDWQRSSSDSQLPLQPSTPSPPLTPPPRPPRTRWLNRSPNHSPKGSPLHQTQPM